MWRTLLFALIGLVLPGTAAAAPPGALAFPYAPASASSGDRVVVAWAAGGSVRTATRRPAGAVGPSQIIGRSGDGRSPLLASTADGDLVLVWLGAHGLQSAFRAPGGRVWTLEPIEPGAIGSKQDISLVVDSGGQAIVIDQGTGNFIGAPVTIYSHAAGGAWTPSEYPDASARYLSAGTDTSGDLAVIYVDGYEGTTSLRASVMLARTASWSAPIVLDQAPGELPPTITGGGGRTFIATWTRANPTGDGPTVVESAARLRLPGTWEPEREIVSPASGPLADEANLATSVDASGDATAVWQFPTTTGVRLASATLGVADADWSAAAQLDGLAGGPGSDGIPAFADARDGSTTIAFLQRRIDGFWLHVASRNQLGAWEGQDDDGVRVSTCAGLDTCLWETLVGPTAVVGGGITAVAFKTSQGVVALRRGASESWQEPVALHPAEPTDAYLRSAHVRAGAITVEGSCGFASCGGNAVVRTVGVGSRVLGRATLAGEGVASHRIALPPWALARLRHGGRLRVVVSIAWSQYSGIDARASRIVALHL